MSETKQEQDAVSIIDSAGKPLSRSRRSFLAHSGMFGAGLVGSALLGACSDHNSVAMASGNDCGPNDVTISGPSDAAVLQYALNLEYLEAQYYLYGLTGSGLQDQDTGGGSMDAGKVTVPSGNTQVNFSGSGIIGQYAAEITADELHHVQFLRSALKSAGALISAPAINLDTSFTAAATAALQGAGITPPSDFTFNPYSSPVAFLIGAFIFEDVGVTAYKGGAQFIRNRDYLTAAAGILSVEGYHAGLIRTLLTQMQDETALTVNGQNVTVAQVVNAISNARNSLDGDQTTTSQSVSIMANDDQGITGKGIDGNSLSSVSIYGTSYDSTNIVPTDSNSITFSRSPAQVHNIVYLTQKQVAPQDGDVPSVAFFPSGTNIAAEPALEESGDQTS